MATHRYQLWTAPRTSTTPQYPSELPIASAPEGDCACPIPALHQRPKSVRPAFTTAYQTPRLVKTWLDDEYMGVFNPMESRGVVVLNQASATLLQHFAEPRPLQDAPRDVPAPILEQLVELGLLHPAATPPTFHPQPPETLTAWIHVTNQCNLSCPYCYVRKSKDAMEVQQGYQAVSAVYRSAVRNGFRHVHLKYGGGEASLNIAVVFALHEHAQKLATQTGIPCTGVILSNGVHLPTWVIAAVKRHRLGLMISLDGIGAAHDAQRPYRNGRGSASAVMATLERLAAYEVIPSISITLTDRNAAELPELVQFLLDRQLPFTFNFYRENDCSVNATDLLHQEGQFIDTLQRVFDLLDRRPPTFPVLNSLSDMARLGGLHDKPCGVGSSYMVITQRGDIAKCHMHLDQPIATTNVIDPLHLIRLDQVGIQNPSVDEKAGCNRCDWRYQCAGGCPALTYRVTGSYHQRSPYCNVYRAILPRVVQLEAHRIRHHHAGRETSD